MKKVYCYYIILIAIILFVSYYNTINSTEEGFIPFINKIYRPYVRNARVYSENLFNKKKVELHNILKKHSIM